MHQCILLQCFNACRGYFLCAMIFWCKDIILSSLMFYFASVVQFIYSKNQGSQRIAEARVPKTLSERQTYTQTKESLTTGIKFHHLQRRKFHFNI